MKIRIKPVGNPGPYVDERDRVWFAYETIRSLRQRPVEQIVELELMIQNEIEDPLPSPRFRSKLVRKRQK